MQVANKLDETMQSVPQIMAVIRQGINYSLFLVVMSRGPFGLKDWSKFLHLSERTLQRIKKDNKRFDPIYTEKILEIAQVQKKGIEVFENVDTFNQWMTTRTIALGGITPKSLLDNTFGIHMLLEELTRIEHGILS